MNNKKKSNFKIKEKLIFANKKYFLKLYVGAGRYTLI